MMNIETNARLISCILPKGRAYALQKCLVEEKGIHTGNFHHSRGVGRDSPITERGIGEQQEREIIEVVVPADQADALFEYMFYKADMDEAHGGMIYMTAIPRTSVMGMPALPDSKARSINQPIAD